MSAISFGHAIGVLLSSALLLPCSARAQNSQSRDLVGFDSIEVSSNVDLVIRQGREFSVEVTADDDVDLENVVTEVRGGTLIVHQERERSGWFFFHVFIDEVEVSVTLPVLRSVWASGGSDVRTEGDVAGDRLEIEASGGSDIRIDLDVEQLVLQTSGGADAILTGAADSLEARSGGGSDVDASGMTARVADLRSSGGSDMIVAVTDRLVARASGGSDIVYSGNPGHTDIDAGGGADIVHR